MGARRLQPVVRRARRDVTEVGRAGQGPGDLGLDGHIAGRLAGRLGIGAVVAAVPEPGDAGDLPGLALQRPGQRRGLAAVQDGPARAGVDAAGGQQDTVADRRHRQVLAERPDHQLLQHAAFQVAAHAAGAVAAGQEQAVDTVQGGVRPGHRAGELRCAQHLRVGVPGAGVGPQDAADQRDPGQPGDARPWIQALTRHHDVVSRGGRAALGGEDHAMAGASQDLPADRDLRGVEITVGDRDEDRAHTVHGRAAGGRPVVGPSVRTGGRSLDRAVARSVGSDA